MKVTLTNNVGAIKVCKVGFSWTTLFFVGWVPIFRGDFKMFLIMILISMFTFGLGLLVFPFMYNRLYIKKLLEKGYTPATEEDRKILQDKNFIIKSLDISTTA